MITTNLVLVEYGFTKTIELFFLPISGMIIDDFYVKDFEYTTDNKILTVYLELGNQIMDKQLEDELHNSGWV